MGLPDSQIISLNKSRKRARYWRQLENGEWHQTDLLPADPLSIPYYFAKGFKATNPSTVAVREASPQVGINPESSASGKAEICPDCGFVAKSEFGLSVHKRVHLVVNKVEPKGG